MKTLAAGSSIFAHLKINREGGLLRVFRVINRSQTILCSSTAFDNLGARLADYTHTLFLARCTCLDNYVYTVTDTFTVH